MNHDARIAALKTRAESARADLTRLSDTVKSAAVRDFFLRLAVSWVGDVEGYILNEAAKATNPADASRWLQLAEVQLRAIEAHLRDCEDAIKKFGPGMESIGG